VDVRTLVDGAQLAAHPHWRVLDCRHDLVEPEKGRAQYAAAHIRGAAHANLDIDLSGPRRRDGARHPLPSADAFTRWLGARGLSAEDTVVAYDDSGGIFAARLWWMLRWMGHRNVAVLDGGLAAWSLFGGPLDSDNPLFGATTYAARPDGSMWITLADVELNVDELLFQLIDARAANRFAGRDETIDRVGGHIPGAVSRPYSNNLAASGRFKTATQLRHEFAGLLGGKSARNVVHQCGSGVTGCHNLLAMEIAGMAGSRLYPGSWSEWCSDPARPIVTSEVVDQS
jgi:thiosulfate/3-mercaptopyruvate sulfurtransferase